MDTKFLFNVVTLELFWFISGKFFDIFVKIFINALKAFYFNTISTMLMTHI